MVGVPPSRDSMRRSGDDDLIRQKRMAVGQVKHGLMRQLLGVIGTRSPLEDNRVIRINDVKVANPAVRDPIDVALDELGKFLVVFAESEAIKIRRGLVERHARLPLDERHGWGDALMWSAAELVDWEFSSRRLISRDLGTRFNPKPAGLRVARTIRDPNRQ